MDVREGTEAGPPAGPGVDVPRQDRRIGVTRRVTILAVAGVVGAILATAAQPRVDAPFTADSVISIQPGESKDRRPDSTKDSWLTVAEAASLPQVVTAARARAQVTTKVPTVTERIRAIGNPNTTLVKVRVAGETQEEAIALSEAVVTEAVTFMRQATRTFLADSDPIAAYGFESGLDGWKPKSIFTTPAGDVRQVTGGADAGQGRLAFFCPPRTTGCGPGVIVARTFQRKQAYAVTARARGRGRVRLVVGSSPTSVAVSPSVVLRPDTWTEMAVEWRPERYAPEATITIQSIGKDGANASVDTVKMSDPAVNDLDDATAAEVAAENRRDRVRRAAINDQFSVVSDATPGPKQRADTMRATVFGALTGIAVAAAAMAAAATTRRRPTA